jgi:hypothetical protein
MPGAAKVQFYDTVCKRLTSLAPTNEESAWLNEEKNLNRKIIVSQLSASDVTHVVSLDTNNQAQVFKESGELV